MKSYAQKDFDELKIKEFGSYYILRPDSLGNYEKNDSCGKFIKKPKNIEFKFYAIDGKDDTLFYKQMSDEKYLLHLEDYGYSGELEAVTQENLYVHYQKDDTGKDWLFDRYSPYAKMRNEVEVRFCEKLETQQREMTLKLYLTYQGDTLPYEQIGDKKYLHPLRDCGMIKYDSLIWDLLIDNGEYIYNIQMSGKDLLGGGFWYLCIHKHYRKTYKEYNYWPMMQYTIKVGEIICEGRGFVFNKKKLAKGKYHFGDEK